MRPPPIPTNEFGQQYTPDGSPGRAQPPSQEFVDATVGSILWAIVKFGIKGFLLFWLVIFVFSVLVGGIAAFIH